MGKLIQTVCKVLQKGCNERKKSLRWKKKINRKKIIHLCLLDSDIFDKVLAIASI